MKPTLYKNISYDNLNPNIHFHNKKITHHNSSGSLRGKVDTKKSQSQSTCSELNELYENENEIFQRMLDNIKLQIRNNPNINTDKISSYKNTKRKLAIDQYMKTKNNFHLSYNIIHLSIYLMDNTLQLEKFKNKIELVSMVCLLLSVKFLENQNYGNIIGEIRRFYDTFLFYSYDLKYYEIIILKYLNYKMNFITSIDVFRFFETYGHRYIPEVKEEITFYQANKTMASSDNDEANSHVRSNSNSSSGLTVKTFRNEFLKNINKIISKFNYISFNVLHLTCACLCITREQLCLKNLWPLEMEISYNISFSDFSYLYNEIKSEFNSNTNHGINSTVSSFSDLKLKKFIVKKPSYKPSDYYPLKYNQISIQPKPLLQRNKSSESFKKFIIKGPDKEKIKTERRRQRHLSLGINSQYLKEYINKNNSIKKKNLSSSQSKLDLQNNSCEKNDGKMKGNNRKKNIIKMPSLQTLENKKKNSSFFSYCNFFQNKGGEQKYKNIVLKNKKS